MLDPESKQAYFKQLSTKYAKCFYPITPPCDGKAIKAHSVQNRGVLAKLVENGHVTMISTKHDANHGPSRIFREVPRSKATTFTGLCSAHDNSLFRPIDDSPLDLTSKEHLFLMAYRSVLFEMVQQAWCALVFQRGYQDLAERGRVSRDAPSGPGLKAVVAVAEASGFYAFTRHYAEAFLQRGWDRIEHRVLELDGPACAFACSGVFDLLGSTRTPAQLQDLRCAALNVFPMGGKSVLVLSYPALHRGLWDPYFASLAGGAAPELKLRISKLVLRHCANFALRPSYAASFSQEKRAALIRYFDSNLTPDKQDYDDPQLCIFE